MRAPPPRTTRIGGAESLSEEGWEEGGWREDGVLSWRLAPCSIGCQEGGEREEVGDRQDQQTLAWGLTQSPQCLALTLL